VTCILTKQLSTAVWLIYRSDEQRFPTSGLYLKLIHDSVYSGLTVHNPNSVPTSLFLILIDVPFESPNDLNLEQMLFGRFSLDLCSCDLYISQTAVYSKHKSWSPGGLV
jgi:hypothetical protein